MAGLCLIVTFCNSSLHAADKYWVGATSSLWNNTNNWSLTSGGAGGAGVPNTNDVARFDANSTQDCDLNAGVNVGGMYLESGFTYAVNHSTSSFRVNYSHLLVEGGTLNGGSVLMDIFGDFTQTGGTVVGTSDRLLLRRYVHFTGGTFTHNNGLVQIHNKNLKTDGTATFYDLKFSGPNHTSINYGGSPFTWTVLNELQWVGNRQLRLDNGTIHLKGDLINTNTYPGAGAGGSAVIIFDDPSADQTLDGTTVAAAGGLPKLQVNKAAGNVILKDYITLFQGFEVIAGTVVPGTLSTDKVYLWRYPAFTTDLTLHHVELWGNTYHTEINIAAGKVLTVNGDLTMSGYTRADIEGSGEVHLHGDMYVTNTRHDLGAQGGKVRFVGTGDQKLSGSTTYKAGRIPHIIIDKPSGTLTMDKYLWTGNGIDHVQGATASATSSTDRILFYYNNVVDGPINLGNVEVYATTYHATNTYNNGPVIHGDLKISGSKRANINGAVSLKGDLEIVNDYTANTGTGTITFDGTGTQNVTGQGAYNEGKLPYITIDKPSGEVVLLSDLYLAKNMTFTNGVVQATASANLVFNDNAYPVGASDLSYVDGPVRKMGNDNFTFPIGDNGRYQPIVMGGASATTDEFTAQYYNVGQTIGSSYKTKAMDGISDCEYWDFNRIVGTSTPDLTFPFDNETCKRPEFLADMLVSNWQYTQWTLAGTGNDGITGTHADGTIFVENIAVFGSFLLAYNGNIYVPPLIAAPVVTHVDAGQPGAIVLNISGGSAPYRVVTDDVDYPTTSQYAAEQANVVAEGTTLGIDMTAFSTLSYWDFITASAPQTYGNLTEGDYHFTVVDTLNDTLELDLRVNTILDWSALTGATVDGYTISKTAGDGWVNMEATTHNALTQADDGEVIVTLPNLTDQQAFGFKEYDAANGANGYEDIKFGFHVNGSAISFVEDGVLIGGSYTLAAGDELKVEKDGTQMKYWQNGTNIRTTTMSGTEKDLLFDAALYSSGGSLNVAAKLNPSKVKTIVSDIICGDPNSGEIFVAISPLANVTSINWTSDDPNFSSNNQSQTNLSFGNYYLATVINGISTNYTFDVAYKTTWMDLNGHLPHAFPADQNLQKTAANNTWNPEYGRSRNLLVNLTNGWTEFTLNDEGATSHGVYYTFRDGTGVAKGGVVVIKLWGLFKIAFPVVNNTALVSNLFGVSNGDVLRVEKEGTGSGMETHFYRNGVLQFTHLEPGIVGNPDMVVHAQLKQGDSNLFKSRSSFPCELTPVYAVTQKRLDGGYYRTYNNVLYFKYYEKYQDGNLIYRIYDKENEVVDNGTLSKSYGLNYYDNFDLGTAGLNMGDYYVLEVENDKGQIEKLRFVYL